MSLFYFAGDGDVRLFAVSGVGGFDQHIPRGNTEKTAWIAQAPNAGALSILKALAPLQDRREDADAPGKVAVDEFIRGLIRDGDPDFAEPLRPPRLQYSSSADPCRQIA